MSEWEYTVSEIGWTVDGDWLRVQQESLGEHGKKGWELVSVVLLETESIDPMEGKDFLAHAMAMYFKRPILGERNMGDKSKGLYNKFAVNRKDGKDAPGEKHDGCEYFVLDLTHDIHALPALQAYSESCEKEYPLLAADLRSWLEDKRND